MTSDQHRAVPAHIAADSPTPGDGNLHSVCPADGSHHRDHAPTFEPQR